MKIALLQMNSQQSFQINCDKINEAAKKCIDQNVQALFLPECFYSMSSGLNATPYLVEENNEHYQRIQSISKQNSLALLGGSAATAHNGKVINRSYNFDQTGKDLGHYDKIHLFSCDLGDKEGKKKIVEADIYQAGSEVKMLNFNKLAIGLGICFDLRFSWQAWRYREMGANLLTYSSAFTVPTGKAHWHTLLKARAIETQCYVVACAQYGRHNDRIQTYGHSLVVDPWGNILLDAGEGEGLHICELDLSKVDEVRRKILMSI
jgi:predicted amidohydrolase